MADTTSGGFALQHAALTVPPVHIPDGHGGAYKTELVIERTPERTVKVLWWHADDPRVEPHNHPWDFESEILHGGYTEDRFWFDGDELRTATHTYRAGDTNRVPREVFHNVVCVQPGTVTRMTCGPAVPGNEWGYLDVTTGERLTAIDPTFRAGLLAINPHLRPAAEASTGADLATATAQAFADLIDREWIASCMAQSGNDPGVVAMLAIADPVNAGIVRAFLTEVGFDKGTAVCEVCDSVTDDWVGGGAEEAFTCRDVEACGARAAQHAEALRSYRAGAAQSAGEGGE